MFSSDFKSIKLVAFDFDGVFTDNRVLVDENGQESVFCWRSDGIGLENLKRLGINIAIISSERNNLVQHRAKKLGIYCKNNVKNKELELIKTSKFFNISLKETIFVGNDINDIPAFKIAGIAVGVGDCHEEAKQFTSFCLKTKGGFGAVRELCDMIFNSYKNKE